MDELTHASFFSGVGGLDLGLERAGWRTVSFSEIDPYASAVLAQRWPGVPNLGDIVELRSDDLAGSSAARHARTTAEGWIGPDGRCRLGTSGTATLWSGGFPCQDLSVAGKRRGLAGSRSGLAFAFLELVGRHRPRFVLLENVPGLLSSHGGKDFGTLLAAMVELGYGVGYRVLDARYFGVPQRRRRVFILGDSTGGRAGAERAAEVLSIGSRCHRHPPAGVEAGPGAAEGTWGSPDVIGTVPASLGHHGYTLGQEALAGGFLQVTDGDVAPAVLAGAGRLGHGDKDSQIVATLTDPTRLRWDAGYSVERSSPDPRGVRAPDGLAGRSHDRGGVAEGYSAVFGDIGASGMTDDPLLPLGLDSHRYRCCGNGVVSDVAEWIGRRLTEGIDAA